MQVNAALLNRLNKPDPWIKLASAALLAIALYLLAKLVWLWVDAFTADYKIPPMAAKPSSQQNTQASQVSVDAIVNKHLFGDVNAAPVQQEVQQVEAEETRLPLKLRGIYASTNDKRASAIIEAGGGQQDVYFLGDKINGGRGAVLHQVQPTKVILNRNGQLESLTLEQEESAFSVEEERTTAIESRAPAAKAGNLVVDNPRVTRELNEIRDKLQSDPASLKDLMRWQPVMENGVLQGVKISPGKARRLFHELKLRRNDVVTNINGIPLNDPSQLLMLQQNLTDATEISLTLLRDGQSQDLTVRLDGGDSPDLRGGRREER